MKINALQFLKYFKYIPKTIYINFRLKCSILRQQPYVPLIITSRLKFISNSSARIIAKPGSYLRFGYGAGGVAAFESTGINLELYSKAIIKVSGISIIGYGSSICVYQNSELEIGDKTYIAGNCTIKCAKKIKIGDGCAISWNVTILDSDFHPWSIGDVTKEIAIGVTIGDHVWIGNNAIILKGVTIGTGSIVGAGSVVTRSVPPNTLVAGNPAKIIHNDVRW